jgi:hypothetical protein
MPPKADTPAPSAPPTEPNASGKWVILGILAVGFTAAGASWWFRYNATHHAATFWGRNAWLIRDADHAQLLELQPAPKNAPPRNDALTINGDTYLVAARQEITQAHGLAHLRNALLEDQSFNWPAKAIATDLTWHFALQFDLDKERTTIYLTDDFQHATGDIDSGAIPMVVSCEPIAKGLRTVIEEWHQAQTTTPADAAAKFSGN